MCFFFCDYCGYSPCIVLPGKVHLHLVYVMLVPDVRTVRTSTPAKSVVYALRMQCRILVLPMLCITYAMQNVLRIK